MAVYYDKKSKTWYTQFRYKDWQGKSHSTTKRGFALKRDAQRYETAVKEQTCQKPNIKLSELAEIYLADYKLNHKETSYINVSRIIKMHILPYLGDVIISDIKQYHIKEWQNTLQTQNRSASSIRTYNVVFSGLINYAKTYYNLQNNPFEQVGMTGKMNKNMVFWELDEFKRFDAAASNPVYKVIFNLLFYSGMRIGELMALTLADFDFISNTINIDKQYNDDLDSISEPKSENSIRKIAMPPSIMKMVRDLFDRYYEVPYMPFGYMTRKGITFALKKQAEAAGLHPIKLHDFRHSHASMLIRQGTNVAAISKRLGHASPATTLSIYSHVYKDEDSNIANMLDTIVSAK